MAPGTSGGSDLSEVVTLLEQGARRGWHDGAQVYVSRHGEVLLDTAVGESAPGRALRTDDVMAWYSSGKPLTTVAVLQCWERGLLGLDDPVARYLPGWGQGKERATLRHLLTHTGGFPMTNDSLYDADVSFAEALAATVRAPAEYEPGTRAVYHAVSSWRILAAVVEAVDGRPFTTFVREDVLEPLGLTSTWLGIPPERQRELGDRIVAVSWRGHRFPKVEPDGGMRMVPYHVDRVHNEGWHIAKLEPGGGARGPARELGRFYEALLGHGPRLLEPATVEVMTAVHRHGMPDAVWQLEVPWGLGVQVDFSGGTSRRTFGHGGMASSRGMVDREHGLVLVMVANGLPGPAEAEQRAVEVTDAVYRALGDDVAALRKPLGPIEQRLLTRDA